MTSRRAEPLNLAAFAHGRKIATDPSGCRYAFNPSKNSWA
jgi:hypothetical protein